MSDATELKNKGNKAFQDGDFEVAIECFTKAIQINPSDHVFYSNRSASYASLKKYQEALEDAEKCVQLKPDWSKGYVRKGLAEFYLEDYENAEKTYTKGLELEPANQQLKEGLQRVKEAKAQEEDFDMSSLLGGAGAGGAGKIPGMDQQSQGILTALLSNPKTQKYFQDPDFLQKLMSIQKNPALLGTYMQTDPRIKEAFETLMGGIGGKGEEHKQEEHVHGENCSHGHSHAQPETKPTKPEPMQEEKPKKQEASQPSNDAEAEKNKGNEEYKKRNFQKAIEHYDNAIRLNPNEAIYLNNKAAVYLELEQYDECISICDSALEVLKSQAYDSQKLGKVLARKASAYARKQDYKTAIEWYKNSLLENSDPKVKDEVKKLEKLQKDKEAKEYLNPEIAEQHRLKGNEYFGQGKYPDAVKEYDEGLRRNPEDPKLYANRATAYMKLLEYPHALRDIDKCLSLDPKYVKAYAKKGVIHHAMKEYHKATESFEKGLKIDPENAECKDGLRKTKEAIMVGNYTETKEDQQERLKHAMADPEIQQILKDPQIHNLLQDIQNNPKDPAVLKALGDPLIAGKLEKLMAAGILRTA